MRKVVGQLILVTVLMWLLSNQMPRLYAEFALVPALVLQKPWTLITYQFLHDRSGLGHIFFNMLGLFFFGPRLEERLGGRHFLGLYLVSGVVGAIVHILFSALPISDGGLAVPMVGASAAVYGVLLGYARFWPKDKILIWFIIPIEIRTAVIGLTLISLWFGLGSGGGNVAYFAHLGGFLGGWLYLRWMEHRSPARQFQRKIDGPAGRMGDRQLKDRWEAIDAERLHEVNRQEYDRIAQQVDDAGWNSLTDRQKTFVERFGGGGR
ncbi:MAG: rhomboid family intramembrane serine protease [Gemmatimonadota bacterium]